MLYVWVLDSSALSALQRLKGEYSLEQAKKDIKFQKVQVHTHLQGSQLVALLSTEREQEEGSVVVIDQHVTMENWRRQLVAGTSEEGVSMLGT